jgi:hypothetical protein
VEGFLTFFPGKTFDKKRRNKMSNLKHDSVNKCFSLLREYIDEGPGSSKQEIARLALNQLQEITAGTGATGSANDGSTQANSDTSCTGRPRFSENPLG